MLHDRQTQLRSECFRRPTIAGHEEWQPWLDTIMPVAVEVMADVFSQPHDVVITGRTSEHRFTVLDISEPYEVDLSTSQCSCDLNSDFELPCPHVMLLESFRSTPPDNVVVPLRWLRNYNRVQYIPLAEATAAQRNRNTHVTGQSLLDAIGLYVQHHLSSAAATSLYSTVLHFLQHPEQTSLTLSRNVELHNEPTVVHYVGPDISEMLNSSIMTSTSAAETEPMILPESVSDDASTVTMCESRYFRASLTVTDRRTTAEQEPIPSTSHQNNPVSSKFGIVLPLNECVLINVKRWLIKRVNVFNVKT
jgi:hypothetical protein